ncbi:type II CAAX endopeptidase family protein [Halococcus sp. PRR34]|uniref:type II CAAX endopeptidase family protein n=1 Tax=Halococcus sp. PRR34 TaxID=3020830 RepID=UPI00236288E1|nr:type II CAAX endopeptidase family protein [Halococcus sp. PRR34]
MSDESSIVGKHPVAVFFFTTFVFSWLVWIGGDALPGTEGEPNSSLWTVPAAFGPPIAAALVLRATDGDLRTWASQALKWRIKVRWYLAAVAVPVLLQALSVLVLGLIGASVFYRPTDQFIFSFLFVFFVGGGQEELGWRGFALPRLQAAYGAFAASLIIGIAWAFWHFPLYLVDGGFNAASAFVSSLRVIPESIIITWLYNSTSGSVLICMIFHAMYNVGYLFNSPASFQFPGGTEIPLSIIIEPVIWWAAALILLSIYGGRYLARTPQSDSAAVRKDESSTAD